MKNFLNSVMIAACALLGCSASVYRVRTDSTTCESLVATDCKDPPADPNRIRLCGNAFANESDFVAEAKHYCAQPVLRNCALQCCDVDCGTAAPASAAPTAPAAQPPAPVPPPPNAAAAPAPASPPPAAATEELPPAPPPPPPAAPMQAPAKP